MPTEKARQFLSRLARGETVPAVLLLGSDLYLRDLCRTKLMEAFVPPEARQWGVSRFSLDDTPLERVLQHARSLPMLSPRQVVFATELETLERLGDDRRDAAVDLIEAYLADPAPFTLLVLEAAALDQRMKLFKSVSAQALVVSVDFAEGRDADGRRAGAVSACLQLMPEMARELGVEIEPRAAEELAELVNGEPARVRAELEKLATFAAPRREITSEDVEALVVGERKYSVWRLAEMLAGRDRRRALEFLDSLLREGEPGPAVVGAMAWMYRKLLEAQEAPAHLTGWDAGRRLGMFKDTAELAIRESRRFPRRQLLEGLSALYEADTRLKSGSGNDRAVLEFLLARLIA